LGVRVSRRAELIALVTATAISATGTAMTFLAVPWFVLSTTGSAVRTGLVATAELAGFVLSSILAGPFIDRFGARRASVAADLVACVAVAAIPVLQASGRLALWILLALALLLGLSRAPGDASRVTMLPAVAGRSGVPMERATSAYEAAARAARMLGGPAAGALIAWLGPPPVLLIDAGTFLLCAGLMRAAIHADPVAPGKRRGSRVRAYVLELAEGIRYVRADRLVRSFMVLTMVTNALDASLIVVLLPVYATTILHSSVALGLMLGTFATGAVLGTMIFAWLGPRLPRWQTFTISFLIMGPPRYLVLLLQPPLPVLLVTLLVSGIALGSINPIMSTVEAERIPKVLRGRVLGAATAGATLGMPIGTAAAGIAVTALGLPITIGVLGVAYLATTLCPVIFTYWREMNHKPAQIPLTSA
jgi:MFS family permease